MSEFITFYFGLFGEDPKDILFWSLLLLIFISGFLKEYMDIRRQSH